MEYLKILAAPVLMIIGGIITWIIKNKTEKLKEAQANLRIQQLHTYTEILEPIIRIFSSVKGNKQDQQEALLKVQSHEYRKIAFDLNLFGSDEVVKAYGDFMQYIYQMEKEEKKDAAKMMIMLGKVILEIRKSLGNKKTKLTEIDMLRFMLKDIK